MPIYEYKCKKCNHVFDAFQRIGEDGSKLECPECGTAKPEKLLSSFASSGADYYSGSSASSSCGSGGFG
jgi:putative FmdB family regulatory protein